MRILITVLTLALSLSLQAGTGIAVLDSMSGDVTVKSGQPLEPLQAFDPVGVEIKTGKGSYAAIVFSNGVSLYLAENSTLRIDAYEQSAFIARPDDFDFEPSRSQLTVSLPQGELGVAMRDSNPLSKFVIELGGDVSVDLKTSLSSVMHQDDTVITAIFDGHGSMNIGEQNLLCNQGYRLSSGAVDHNERIRLMTDQQIEKWRPLSLQAKIALQRWYFQTPQEGVIDPIRLKPAAYRSSRPYNNTKL